MLDLVLRMLKDLYGISMTWLLENKKNVLQLPGIMSSELNSGSCRWGPCYIFQCQFMLE